MNTIYNFEAVQPPALSEKMLQIELKRRKTQRQTTLVAIAGVITQLCMLLISILLLPVNITLAIIGFAYVCVSLSGSSVIMVVFTQNRRSLI